MLLTFWVSSKERVAVLSKRHRKSSKKVVVQRTVTAAGAVAATASLAFVGPTAQAAAAAPDYKGAVTDSRDALNNYLAGTNAIGSAAGGVWNPIAGQTGGLLPTFGTTLTHSNLTRIADLPNVLRNLASTPLPTGVPGVIPSIKIPGQGFVDLPLPTTIPGANLINGLADVLDGLNHAPIIGPIVNELPPLSDIVDGLIAEQDKFTAGYNWPLLQVSGLTTLTNTFIQTPSGLNIKIPAALDPLGVLPDSVRVLPDGSLPNVTAWVPMGAGNYKFPLGMETGWWATAPTLVVDGGPLNFQQVLSVPMWANGITAPLGLGQAGQFNAHVLIPTENGIYSPIGTTLSNFSIPMLGLGMTNLNVTTGNYIGTNGFNINNGQNVMVLQMPFTGALPIPIVYSLGGFNMGTEGMGFTLPSLFGVGLMPTFQLGTAPGANTPLGIIPPNLIPTGAIVPTQLITVTGLLSTALGIPDPTVELAKALTPLYKGLVTPLMTPISDLLTQQYGNLFNGAASNTLQASKFYKDVMTQLGSLIGAAPTTLSSPAPNALAAAATSAPAAKQAETPAAASKELGTPAPEVKQLEAPKLDLGSSLVAVKDKVAEKVTSAPASSSVPTASELSAAPVGEPAVRPAAEPSKEEAKDVAKDDAKVDAKDSAKDKAKPAKPVVKEKLQDKVDKANQSLKKQVTDTIKNTGGVVTATVTNTVESVNGIDGEGAKSSTTNDSSAAKESKAKQDNDSGKHHDDGATGNSNKVKVKTPSESGGKHRASDASGGGSNGSNAGGGSDGSGSHGGSGSKS
ncbi:hypothetical protein [Mycobacteroides sp. LB1]|uniref:hypothetical protein n=1 Tax=Mycobacteroides sp. LB1 TaxID=2750814 RepID=UPI0015DEBAB0|nr:hypothetical protein [Mycobacteroides sp. LB1]